MSERNPAATLAASSAREPAAREATEKPRFCPNCAEREPTRLVEGVKKGKLGIPVAVWLCDSCAQSAEAKLGKLSPKKRRAVKGRISAGKYGTTIMKLAYRFGGFTARQLGPMLLLEQPGRFARTKASSPDGAAHKAAYEALLHLKTNKLMKSVGVWREHAVGPRDGRIEEFYHLHAEGVLWGARANGVADAMEARKSYKDHQLPRRAEHSAYRNDIYLRILRDFDESRRSWGDLSDLDTEDKRLVVVSKVSDFNGESWEGYPYTVGPLVQKRTRGGRKYELLYPDGHPTLRWADGLECAFEVEAERESWAREAARKVDRYAGYWLRLYKEMEAEWRSPEVAPLEEELARLEAERDAANIASGDSIRWTLFYQENPHLSPKALKSLWERIAAFKAKRPEFLGLPEEVAPVIFVHETAEISEGVRKRLQARQYPIPRLDEFRDYLLGVMSDEWALDALNASHQRRQAAGLPLEDVGLRGYPLHVLNRLFLFTSWEELKPKEHRNLSTGEVYKVDKVGHTLAAVLTPMGVAGEGAPREKMSLRAVAEERAALAKLPAQEERGVASL